MGLKIVRYEPAHERAVEDFNRRLSNAGVDFQFFERCASQWLPPDESAPVYRTYRLALDNEGVVRGAYGLRVQDFSVKGETHSVANYQLPLSEGIFDPNFRTVGTRLLRSALREFPLLYSLGMGGIDKPLPRLLNASGFDLALVPFFFRVLRASTFLKEMEVMRRSPMRRLVAMLSSSTKLGPLAIHTLQKVRTRIHPDSRYSLEEVQEWGADIDEIWAGVNRENCIVGVRHAEALSRVFPSTNSANRKFILRRDGNPVGYVVVRSTAMTNDRYFGNMTLGSIVDGWAADDDVGQLVCLATRELQALGADLVISNQIFGPWTQALTAAGYLSFQSNFGLAVSPKLSSLMGGTLINMGSHCHFNRSDGDGPIHI